MKTFLATALAALSVASAHAAYVVTDLGTLAGGTSSYAYAINDSDQVVG